MDLLRNARFRVIVILLTIASVFSLLRHSQKVFAEPASNPGLISRIKGGAATWDGRAWRQLMPGDALEREQTIRISGGGSVELKMGGATFILGPATNALPKFKTGTIELSRGSLHAKTSSDTAVKISTPIANLDITNGEAMIAANSENAFVTLVRGTASLILAGDGSKRELHAGDSIHASAKGMLTLAFPKDIAEALQTKADTGTAGSQSIGRLMVRDSAGREMDPLEVRELRVRAHIDGAVALTEIEQTFFNPTDRQAEGTFYFPLPAGATLSRFAMYVNGTLVEGELVDRERARTVYEEIVRKMQDPALMEWQEGNIFKTRIFPIPAHGPKRILISYTQLLPATDGQRCYVYPLVSKTTQSGAIGKFEFEAELPGVSKVTSTAAYSDAVIQSEKDFARVKLARKNFHPEQDFVLRFGARRDSALEMVTDRRAGEDGFFLLSYLAGEKKTEFAKSEITPAGSQGRDLIVMLDTSLSRRADDYKAQLKVVRTLLQELLPKDRFTTISFDVAPRLHQATFVNGPEAANKAMADLEAILPLGATNVESAFVALARFLDANAPRGRPDIVLISDGIATLGETAPEKLAARIIPLTAKYNPRIHSVAMGAQHDRLLLREIARQSGGLFRVIIPGDGVDSESFKLALALESQLLPAPKFEFAGGEIYDIFPAQPGTLVPGEELILAGRYKAAGKLSVKAAYGGTDHSSSFDLPETHSRHVYVPRLWARERLDALMLAPQTPELIQQITHLSQEFTLITPYTSFLVLENESEYEKYGIKRHLRRRYWEEAGKLRSTPPPEEVRPVAPPAPPPPPVENIVKAPEPPKPIPETPKPFTLADLDLSLLGQRYGDGREVATALSTLCLETYYRYMQLSDGTPQTRPGPANVSDRVPITGLDTPAPIQGRDIEAIAQTIAAPTPTDTTPENLEAHRAETELDRQVTRGNDDFLSNVPLDGNEMLLLASDMGVGSGSYSAQYGGRRVMVVRHGGAMSCESATDNSLSWFPRHQYSDGHWGAAGFEETSLSILTLLGAGYTEKVGEHKESVRKGVAWLIARQKPSGQIGSSSYEQALATFALSEAAGMANIPATKFAAQQAIEHLASLQAKNGEQRMGWVDRDGKNHPLISAWAVMALKSAKVAGLRVDSAVFEGAVRYFEQIMAPDGAVGAYGKPDGKEVHLLHTAAAGLALQYLGFQRDDPRIVGAASLLYYYVDKSPGMERDGMFLRYFGTQLMFQQGGKFWTHWNNWLKAQLVETQIKSGENAGSWEPAGIYVLGRVAPPESQNAAVEISTAINAAIAAPHDSKAFETLASALSQTSDLDVLRRAWEEVGQAPQEVRALVRMRRALVNLQLKKYDEALGELRSAWQDSGRAENVLKYYVGALRKAEKANEALEILLADLNAGRITPWRRAMSATLLFDPELKIADPAAFVAARLAGAAAKDLDLLVAFAQSATAKDRHDMAAVFFEQAYQTSDRNERYVSPYVNALCKASRGGDALRLLLTEANAGRSSRWRVATIAGLLLDKQANAEAAGARISKDLAAQSDIRLAVLLHTAEKAEQLKQLELAAELFGMAYPLSGRREHHAMNYVRLLRLSGKSSEARELLTREARDDNRLTPWRMSAMAELVLSDPRYKDAPDKFGDEHFAQRPRARVAFKYELAHAADNAKNFEMAARLYEDIYISGGRPASVVQPYVIALMAVDKSAKAASELERVIQAGYHTTWAFQTLGESYRKTQRGETEILRALSSETEIFPKDVQPHINLAQYYERAGKPDAALAQYMEAVRLKPEDSYFYKQVVERAVTLGRYDVAHEMLATMNQRFANTAGIWGPDDADLLALLNTEKRSANGGDADLRKKIRHYLVKDLVVVMNWDTNATDIDLHVTDPAGEECFYSHTRTAMGASLDHDDTDGFGPETIALRRAKPGKYKIDVVFYGGIPRTVATVQIFRNRNGEDETVTTQTVELRKTGDRVNVQTIEITK